MTQSPYYPVALEPSLACNGPSLAANDKTTSRSWQGKTMVKNELNCHKRFLMRANLEAFVRLLRLWPWMTCWRRDPAVLSTWTLLRSPPLADSDITEEFHNERYYYYSSFNMDSSRF